MLAKYILSIDSDHDYEELINRVQRHTKCRRGTCLRKKGKKLECCYKAPWKQQSISTLTCEENGKKNMNLQEMIIE